MEEPLGDDEAFAGTAPGFGTAVAGERTGNLLRSAVDAGQIPGAVALVRWRGQVVLHEAFGSAALVPDRREMRPDTVFDLASLTKPLATTAVTLALVDRGRVTLDEEVTSYLPELKTARAAGVTFRRLLTHSSGLSGWRPLYVRARSREAVLAAIDDLGITYAPGSRFEYSDLGFITLGIAIERIADQSLDELARELVFDGCGLRATGFRPAAQAGVSQERYASTEQGNTFERGMAEWAGLSFDQWRQSCYPGEVNDGNAHYALGGIAGHAGLFADAQDVGVLGQMWLDGGVCDGRRIMSEAAVRLATTDQAPAGGARRGLGWALMSSAGPTHQELTRADAGFFPPSASPWGPRPSGELLSPGSFGHTGFTGTSLWIDPATQLVAVLLTNATHPTVDLGKGMDRIRARFHNLLAASVQGVPRR